MQTTQFNLVIEKVINWTEFQIHNINDIKDFILSPRVLTNK